MANNVTNRIEFYGEQDAIDKILNLIKGEQECIDFDKIVPTPSHIYMGSVGPAEREKYGKDNWYDWRCAHWGTKWNAYFTHLDEDNNAIEFDTAWSCPINVLDKLAEICYEHGVSFTGKWADEDTGFNVGVFESDCDGDEYWFSFQYITSQSDEAYEIYMELKGENNCLGKDEDGHWFHYDCENCPNANIC